MGFAEDNLWISSQYIGTDTDETTKREMKVAFIWMLVFLYLPKKVALKYEF